MVTIDNISDIKTILEIAAQVFRYFARARRSQALPVEHEEQNYDVSEAVATTLNEWSQEVRRFRPDAANQLTKLGTHFDRSEYLRGIAAEYSAPLTSPWSLELKHTRVEGQPYGNLRLSFGESRETSPLKGEGLTIKTKSTYDHGGEMALPAFKVTMLGDSGSGKTVFMSSMYARLRDGLPGIAIKAMNDAVDLELGDTIERLLMHNKWPPGTEIAQRSYDFELLVNNKAISQVDWVDYRGGALLEEPDSEGGKILARRLRESHAIIWMVDMEKLGSAERIDGMRERIQTRVARMAAISRHAMQGADHPRAWIFVRTKADTVTGLDGRPDWSKASQDLIRHLGPAVEVATSGRNSRAAALPVSAVGRIKGTGDQKELLGDEPSFVEWPLLLSLAFLAQAELDRLRMAHYQAKTNLDKERPGWLETFARDFLSLGPRDSELASIRQLGDIAQRLIGVHATIAKLLRDCPAAVKFLGPSV